jgi:hypothetical protein
MTKQLLEILTVGLLLTMFVPKANATGNVLLPDDSSSSPTLPTESETTPNMTPAPATPITPELPPATTTIQPQVIPNNVRDLADQIIPKSPGNDSNFQNYTATPPAYTDPTNSHITTNITLPTPIITKGDNDYNIVYPTTIIQTPDIMSMPPMPFGAQPAHTISVDFTQKNWTQNDLDQINKKLGIDETKIPSLCYIRGSGFVVTDKLPRTFDTGTTLHADVGYDGSITNVMINIQALCNLVPLSGQLGFVKQVGNKYAVDLGMSQCKPLSATTTVSAVNITRASDTPMGVCQIQ